MPNLELPESISVNKCNDILRQVDNMLYDETIDRKSIQIQVRAAMTELINMQDVTYKWMGVFFDIANKIR